MLVQHGCLFAHLDVWGFSFLPSCRICTFTHSSISRLPSNHFSRPLCTPVLSSSIHTTDQFGIAPQMVLHEAAPNSSSSALMKAPRRINPRTDPSVIAKGQRALLHPQTSWGSHSLPFPRMHHPPLPPQAPHTFLAPPHGVLLPQGDLHVEGVAVVPEGDPGGVLQ